MANLLDSYGLDFLEKDEDTLMDAVRYTVQEGKAIKGYYDTPYFYLPIGSAEFWASSEKSEDGKLSISGFHTHCGGKTIWEMICTDIDISPKDRPKTERILMMSRSTDNGKTWTEPQTLIEGQGEGKGYGDPALVQCENGDVLCLFAGHNGYFQSTVANPICVFMCRSTDRGQTWGDTVNLTSVIWDVSSGYHGAFVASGNGLRLKRGPHAGRVLFAAAVVRNGENVSDNFVIYSDDNGHTWQRSQKAFNKGDEAKLMELNDGTVLISVRRTGARGYNHSEDGGVTWGTQGYWNEMTINACNGEMLRVDEKTLIHSIPNSMNRENVSIFTSTDEGQSWHSPVLLVEGPSVYSSLTLLKDGTIGCYVEKGPDSGCDLWFYRFNVAWLLGQQ